MDEASESRQPNENRRLVSGSGAPPSPTDSRPSEPPSTSEIIPLPSGAERSLEALGIDPADPKFRTAVLIGTAFAGPLPPPNILADYADVSPDLPSRIIGWTDRQMAHRQSLELMTTKGAERRMDRGQVLTACVTGMGLILSTIDGLFGNPFVGGVIAVVSIGGPTAAFILARSVRWEDRQSAIPQTMATNAGHNSPKPVMPDGRGG